MRNFNKIRSFVMLLLLLGGMSLNAQYVTIGTATGTNGNSSAGPINIYYESMHYQVVYTVSELVNAGFASGAAIQELSWDITNLPTNGSGVAQPLPNYSIRMGHTTNTTSTTTNHVPSSGLSLVYSNATYTPTVLGFDMLLFSTPFIWNGVDNIVIDVCWDPVADWESKGQVSIYSATDGSHFYRADGASQCGITTSFNNGNLNEKPVVQFFIVNGGNAPSCSMVNNDLAASSLTSTTATLTWTHPGTPVSYIIEYGPAGFTAGTGTSVTSTTPSVILSGLNSAFDYSARVQAVCGTAVGDTSYARSVSFSTDCPASLAAPITESFNGAGLACLSTANSVLNSGGGWQNVGWVAANSSFYSAPTGYDAGKFLYFETQGAFSGQTDTLYFLPVDLTALTTPFMDFFWWLDYTWSPSGSFDIQIGSNGNWVSAFSRSGGQNIYNWSYSSIDLSAYAGGTIGVRIVGTASGGWEGGAAIDKLRIKEAPTAACSIQATPLTEGFENGGVMNPCWEQSTLDNLNWIVQTGGTPSAATGPTGAASGTYYAYIESSPVTPGDSAILMSPPINTNNLTVPALYFKYHMFGNDYMRLRVEYEIFGSEIWNPIWEKTGSTQTTNADPFEEGYVPLLLATDQVIRIRFIAVAEANDGVSTTAGSAFASDIAIDDIRIAEVITNDVTITNVFTPENGCGFGVEPVTIELTNRGFSAHTNIPVFLAVNGSIPVGVSSGNIPGNGGVGTVTVMVDMTQLGNYDLLAFTALEDDEFPMNDTATASAYSQPQIVGEYDEHFEMSDGNWYAEGDWEYGMPAGTVISNAGAGASAFVTNLSGNYADSKMSYLYSPCFDLSAMTAPIMRFSINWDLEDDWDGAWLEYSVNDGTSWDKLGANDLAGQNWYTDSITQNPYGWAWNGTGANGSNGWVDAIIDLQAYGLTAGQNVRFRFVLAADASTNNEGVGIDNFGIFDGCIATVANETIVNESVAGAADGSIALSPVAGFGGYSFAWSNGSSSNSISGLAPGTYTVSISDAFGCTTTNSFTVLSLCPASLGLSATIGNEIGDGSANGSALITASAGTAPYTYSWSNGVSLNNAFDLTAGTYTVVVTDANGCTETIDAVVVTNYLIGTENIKGLTNLVLSPNPAKDYAQLNISFENSVDLTVALIDVTGRVLETRHAGNTANEQMRFDVNNLAEGVYFLKITANGESIAKRFVVVK